MSTKRDFSLNCYMAIFSYIDGNDIKESNSMINTFYLLYSNVKTIPSKDQINLSLVSKTARNAFWLSYPYHYVLFLRDTETRHLPIWRIDLSMISERSDNEIKKINKWIRFEQYHISGPKSTQNEFPDDKHVVALIQFKITMPSNHNLVDIDESLPLNKDNYLQRQLYLIKKGRKKKSIFREIQDI